MIRVPVPEDAVALAALHVACRDGMQGGLLPASGFARCDRALREAQWARVLSGGATRAVRVPGAGFAMAGSQRDATVAERFPDELYALYLLRGCHGRAVPGIVRAGLFTATAVAGNLRAGRFYAAAGGVGRSRRTEVVDGMAVTGVVFGFAA